MTEKEPFGSLPVRLGVNIDHVATVRNARGRFGDLDPVARACRCAMASGAQFITAHLREDRRHIRDEDVRYIGAHYPFNLEMAVTPELIDIALALRPDECCLVPERRQELTTEGGLNMATNVEFLEEAIQKLEQTGIRVSLFIEPSLHNVVRAKDLGARAVELHTGSLARAYEDSARRNFEVCDDLLQSWSSLNTACRTAHGLNLGVHAGHGLTFDTAFLVASIPYVEEVSVGHFIVSESIFSGWEPVVERMAQSLRGGRALCRSENGGSLDIQARIRALRDRKSNNLPDREV